ncbi:hypothetical protein NBRC10512_005450 [Rhodotorula toruloides]|uniref:RHTO0S22e01508g1_1 n=2 Tax=Rhodotorula toruloides TaxID=5286 RepID=A0A061BPP9_RHOTO|nr:arsenical resistance protein ArsH [Rhodotorula toruloides NP11]EMS18926.1 arsenical resistance protein ArsH [Rhodotorula toruloides NP11]CDR49024.1 RHTO0S22e01508g1_1 [Rhodotorula toruloides]
MLARVALRAVFASRPALAVSARPRLSPLLRTLGMTATLSNGHPPSTLASVGESIAHMREEEVDRRYRPFLATKNGEDEPDWVEALELDTAREMQAKEKRVKVLVLYGSLRQRSFSRLTAYEAARVLARLGADVRVFDPTGLPIKDDVSDKHEKVVELRALSDWSDAHFWCSPEQHGTVTAVFKNQIDWIPLSVGSVRPTQGRTVAVCQVNGGSQSFNVVNLLRVLGRWMRMFAIPNQSSIPMAWKQYTSSDRLLPSSNRDRLVDICEELIKVTLLLRPHFDLLGDRYSEREEKREHGRLRTQAEVEAAKNTKGAQKDAK